MQYNTSSVMRNAWALAREIAAVSPGTKARDWLGYALKDAWKHEKERGKGGKGEGEGTKKKDGKRVGEREMLCIFAMS